MNWELVQVVSRLHPTTAAATDSRRSECRRRSDGWDQLIMFCSSRLPPLRRDWKVVMNAADKSVELVQVFCSRQ